MRLQIKFFGLVAICLATLLFSGMECPLRRTAILIEVVPGSGSRIQADETIIATFDDEPRDLRVIGAEFSVAGSTATIAGPFDPGDLTLVLTWAGDGVETLTYTVEAPEAEKPPVVKYPPVVPGSNLIVPGWSVDGIKIGDPLEKVKQLYGEPDHPNDRLFIYSKLGLTFFAGDGDKNVDDIMIISPSKAKTVGGVGIGSTRQQVESEFGKLREGFLIDLGGWQYLRKGISFTASNGKVSMISIFKPI